MADQFIPLPVSDVAEWDDDARLDRFPPGFPMTGGDEGTRAWDETKHPRQPSGSDKGGEFSPKMVEWTDDDLVADALYSWIGYPSAMRIHMARELEGAPDPDNRSALEQRMQARALLSRVRSSPPTRIRLYRGAPSLDQALPLPQSWSENRKIAENWAAKAKGGRVFVLEPGEARGLRMRDVIQHGHDVNYEKQWLLDPESYPADLTRSTWDESKHPRDPGGEGGGQFIKKGTVAADEGSEGAVPGPGSGRPDVRFSEATPEEFLAALQGNERAWNLTEHTAEELAGSQVFLSEDGKTGITVSPEGDIQNAFRNPGGVKGSGKQAVVHAMMHGGVTLDCYDGYLPDLYGSLGFVVTGRMKFNPEYAPEGMPEGEAPDVVFMAVDAKPSNKFYDDWDEAKAAARRSVGKRKIVDARDAVALAGWGQVPFAAAPRAEGLEGPARRYDPNQPRDPGGEGGGQWIRVPGGASGVISPWKQIVGAKSEFPASEVTMDNLSPEEQQAVRAFWKKQTGQSADTIVSNLREVFELADAEVVEAGRAWYQGAHDWATDQARVHDLSPETTAGVISAMSPMTEWGTNQRLAGLMFQYYSTDPDGFRAMSSYDAAGAAIGWARERGEKWPMGAGKRNAEMAARILQGETPDAVLPQAKTRSFYNSILDPTNPIDVVMDTHMINAAYGGNTPGAKGLVIEVDKPAGAKAWGPLVTPEGAKFIPRKPASWFSTPKARLQSVGVAPLISDAVREVTAEWNAAHPDRPLVPLQTQAIIWTQWLKMHPAQEKRGAVKATQRATEQAALAALAAKARARAQWRL